MPVQCRYRGRSSKNPRKNRIICYVGDWSQAKHISLTHIGSQFALFQKEIYLVLSRFNDK